MSFSDIAGLVSLLDSPEADRSPQLQTVKAGLGAVLRAYAEASQEEFGSPEERVAVMEVLAAATAAVEIATLRKGSFGAAHEAFKVRLARSPLKSVL